MFKGRLGSTQLWKPKNPHSLEYLKYLQTVLAKNATVTESNRVLLVEVLRSIAEIMIWGDQNDSTVFDFFLEKNMLSHFLSIMRQKCGRFVCVQLLQTLNILFENLRNETSLYYLFSNNLVNQIIVHRFDFSDEEILAYYISFLKTLSLKLNTFTIHFFFNESTGEFPLYTEAVKFFNHSESMVRIAVRTITLNVYQVNDAPMLKFVRDTTAPYFSNLVWFIGNHVVEIDGCLGPDVGYQIRDKLADLVGEHLDHLHYVNDIVCLKMDELNDVLAEQLLRRLFVPLYLGSLAPSQSAGPHISTTAALFVLSQVFLIITHLPLVEPLAEMILRADGGVLMQRSPSQPSSLVTADGADGGKGRHDESDAGASASGPRRLDGVASSVEPPDGAGMGALLAATDGARFASSSTLENVHETSGERSPPLIVRTVLDSLDCSSGDRVAFFALCLIYALAHNPGVNAQLLASSRNCASGTSSAAATATSLHADGPREGDECLSDEIVDRVLRIVALAVETGSPVRVVTVELACSVLHRLVTAGGHTLENGRFARLVAAQVRAAENLAHFYETEELFLDIFEDEYAEFKRRVVNMEHLSGDADVLLPGGGVPAPSSVELTKRLPSNERERLRVMLRCFFIVRRLLLQLSDEPETKLPLADVSGCVRVDDCLDLNSSDLLSCTLVQGDGARLKRFLVADGAQLILVEPDARKLGWGVVTFAGFLEDVDVCGDREDSRALHVTVHQAAGGRARASARPLLAATRFLFDDHIRCMAAKQRLTKSCQKARQHKLDLLASLLEIKRDAAATPPSARPRAPSSPSMMTPLDRSGASQGLHSGTASNRTAAASSAVPGHVSPSHANAQWSKKTRRQPGGEQQQRNMSSMTNSSGGGGGSGRRSRAQQQTPTTRSRQRGARMAAAEADSVPLEELPASPPLARFNESNDGTRSGLSATPAAAATESRPRALCAADREERQWGAQLSGAAAATPSSRTAVVSTCAGPARRAAGRGDRQEASAASKSEDDEDVSLFDGSSLPLGGGAQNRPSATAATVTATPPSSPRAVGLVDRAAANAAPGAIGDADGGAYLARHSSCTVDDAASAPSASTAAGSGGAAGGVVVDPLTAAVVDDERDVDDDLRLPRRGGHVVSSLQCFSSQRTASAPVLSRKPAVQEL